MKQYYSLQSIIVKHVKGGTRVEMFESKYVYIIGIRQESGESFTMGNIIVGIVT